MALSSRNENTQRPISERSENEDDSDYEDIWDDDEDDFFVNQNTNIMPLSFEPTCSEEELNWWLEGKFSYQT